MWQQMSRFVPAVLGVLLMAACSDGGGALDHDWLRVLHHKKVAVSPQASQREKQVYADTLGAFVQQHPQHGRARQVYQRIQLDFARELAAIGRYQDAIRFYRAVLANDPANAEAARGVADAVDRLAVPRPKLLALEKGMSQRQVAQLLGKPIPGWTSKHDRGDVVNESWYYRTSEGGVAGVYFRDGVLLAAEATSHEKIAPLTR
jgi:tetratricopeptide (TPR) repeat protein